MERNRRGRPRHPDVLTPAEWRVLDALREGGTNAEIAERLGLSLDTVKYHISNMLAKLELRDRRSLASWRPEERRGRLGALFTVPAFVWSVARPIAWVGAGTAAVAGVVVGVVAVVALVAVVLVTAGGDADPPLAGAPPPTQTSTPAPTATPSPTAAAMPTSTSVATPTSTLGPTPLTLPTREDLGIREIDTVEAFAAAGLTHVRYEAGEEVPWEAGLYLLNVATGTVAGWIRTSGDAIDETERGRSAVGPVSPGISALSPGNQFLLFTPEGQTVVLHDRQSGRSYSWPLPQSQGDWNWALPALLNPHDLIGWNSGDGERLIFLAESGALLIMDDSLRPVAQLQLPKQGRIYELKLRPSGHLLTAFDRLDGRLYYFDLLSGQGAALEPMAIVVPPRMARLSIHVLDDHVSVIGRETPPSCRIVRFDWSGQEISDVSVMCDFHSVTIPSPDGSLIVLSTEVLVPGLGVIATIPVVHDAVTGQAVFRIIGAWTVGDTWLADSSGFVVGTSVGRRIVTRAGLWASSGGHPAPDDRNLLLVGGGTYEFEDGIDITSVEPERQVRVVDLQGRVRSSLRFGDPTRVILGLKSTWLQWGGTAEELRIQNGIYYETDPPPPSPPGGVHPVIERPPFGARLLVEVVVGTCLNLRDQPDPDAPIRECLVDGTVAEIDGSRPGPWMHIRTEDGVEGWAHADYLRWHSDGVRLEE